MTLAGPHKNHAFHPLMRKGSARSYSEISLLDFLENRIDLTTPESTNHMKMHLGLTDTAALQGDC